MVSYNQLLPHLHSCRSTENNNIGLWPDFWGSRNVARLWRYKNLKYIMVTTLTFWGHVTSSVTWPLDSRHAVSYTWSIVTIRLSCTVMEI